MKDAENSLSEQGREIAQNLEEKINSADLDVPMLPDVAHKVVTLSQSSDSDALQLAKLIQSDQSLAGHVMRIANSAAYSPNSTLLSLQQAITRLGMTLISEIAIAACINTKMFNTPGFEKHVAAIWKHALTTALWSKEVARACRRNVEATFLCGLLHSIGRPVVLHTSSEIAGQLGWRLSDTDGVTLEHLYQRQVGVVVVEKWAMPAIICESIAYFDHYENAPHAQEQTAIVKSGALIANYLLTPDQLTKEQLFSFPIFGDLNLYQDEIAAILDRQDDVKNTAEAMST